MKRLISGLFLIVPSIVLGTANYVYHDPTSVSDNPSGYNYRKGTVNGLSTIYDNESVTIAVKVEYNGWVTDTKIAYTTDGSTPTVSDNVTPLDWWANGTYAVSGEPQIWGKVGVIPQQTAGTEVKYIIWSYHSDGGDWIYANGGDDGLHNDQSEATVFSFTVLDDASLPVSLSKFSGKSLNGFVQLDWSTDSEIENLGFNIYRSLKDNPLELLASFTDTKSLEGYGSTNEYHEYSYNDNRVEAGQTYRYVLADVDYNGVEKRHDDRAVTLTYTPGADEVKPVKFALGGAYPNPFNPSTRIQYTVPDAGSVNFTIYDLQGRALWTASQTVSAGGEHQVVWSGMNNAGQLLPSGLYILQMQAGDFQASQKVSLVR